MNGETIVITLVSSIISGILATAITLYINYKMEQRKIKRDLVDDIFGYRYQLSVGGQNSDKSGLNRALNRIPIVFCKDEKVLSAYDKFFEICNAPEALVSSQEKDDVLVTLYKEICKAAKIEVKDWNDSRIKRVFTVR